MRKPRALQRRGLDVAFVVGGGKYHTRLLWLDGEHFNLSQARRLHKWLADAIKWMEEKGEG